MMDGTEHMVGVYLAVAGGFAVTVLGALGLAVLTKYLLWSSRNRRRGVP